MSQALNPALGPCLGLDSCSARPPAQRSASFFGGSKAVGRLRAGEGANNGSQSGAAGVAGTKPAESGKYSPKWKTGQTPLLVLSPLHISSSWPGVLFCLAAKLWAVVPEGPERALRLGHKNRRFIFSSRSLSLGEEGLYAEGGRGKGQEEEAGRKEWERGGEWVLCRVWGENSYGWVSEYCVQLCESSS